MLAEMNVNCQRLTSRDAKHSKAATAEVAMNHIERMPETWT
jgi:hypothetical protein